MLDGDGRQGRAFQREREILVGFLVPRAGLPQFATGGELSELNHALSGRRQGPAVGREHRVLGDDPIQGTTRAAHPKS